jgi:hypothetical protein
MHSLADKTMLMARLRIAALLRSVGGGKIAYSLEEITSAVAAVSRSSKGATMTSPLAFEIVDIDGLRIDRVLASREQPANPANR